MINKVAFQSLNSNKPLVPKKTAQQTTFTNAMPNSTSIRFEGAREDSFYKTERLYGYDEPFTDAANSVATKSEYEALLNDWDKAATNHALTKVGAVGVSGAMAAAGHHYAVAHHLSDLAAGTFAAGSTAGGLLVKPIVKTFFVEPDKKVWKISILQGRAQEHERRINEVKRIGRVAQEKAREDASIWIDKSGDMRSVLHSMIADTEREQNAFKDVLPVIKGKSATKRHLVPVLERSHSWFKPELYDNNDDIHYNYFSEEGTPFGFFGGTPSLHRAVEDYSQHLQTERDYYNPDINVRKERMKAAKHLNDKVPDLINYLKGN